MPKTVTVQVKGTMAAMTPYAMSRMSGQMYQAALDYTGDEKIPFVKYYLHCASIELGLKASILAIDCTPEKKEFLKNRLGHNLEKAINQAGKKHDLSFLNKSDRATISKVNPFFKGKGLEYFTIEMLTEAVTGFKKLPSIGALEAVARKIQTFQDEHQRFINSRTTMEPTGLISFI